MIVVDTNVIAYLFIPGPKTKYTRKTFQNDPKWCAPLLWRSEFLNILSLYIRKKHLTIESALDIVQEAGMLLEGREYQTSHSDVLTLSRFSQCTAYDCEFVSIAHALRIKLVTSDRRVIQAFPDTAVAVDVFGI